MDFFLNTGLDWILKIQGLGAWLRAPTQFFTSLGYEDFYLLILPLLYWSIDARLGLRVGLILITSSGVNELFKLAFAGPRPYWISTQVNPYSAETSFGVPSGHAQHAVSVWGMMAAYLGKPWSWIVAVALMFLIGFSRMYLGVHFPHDVIVGWLIGACILTIFVRVWDGAAARVRAMSLGGQMVLAFLASMILVAIGGLLVNGLGGYQLPEEWLANALRAGAEPDPVSMDGILTSGGLLFGLGSGAAWIMSRGGFQAGGPITKRALRYVVGLVGVVILWMGLGELFPRNEELISYSLRYLRYALIGFWVSGGAPWLFFRFKLSEYSHM
jgi:membrane-associated phospholipid phosphatase